MNETDPAILFGGTWERISGRFLLGCGGDGPGGALHVPGEGNRHDRGFICPEEGRYPVLSACVLPDVAEGGKPETVECHS